jgi:hypothetical protein
MRQIAEFVAVLACGLFTGAAVYVSLVEHPARMECGGEIATAEFAPSYHRGTILQVTLAAVCLLSVAGATFWWVVAGVLQVSVIPFTLIVILPTVQELPGDRHRSLFPSLAFAFLFLKIYLQVGIMPSGNVCRDEYRSAQVGRAPFGELGVSLEGYPALAHFRIESRVGNQCFAVRESLYRSNLSDQDSGNDGADPRNRAEQLLERGVRGRFDVLPEALKRRL